MRLPTDSPRADLSQAAAPVAGARIPVEEPFVSRRTEIAIMALGFGGVALIALTVLTTGEYQRKNERSETAIQGFGRDLTKSHIWLEQAISGNAKVNLEREVYGNLDASARMLELLAGNVPANIPGGGAEAKSGLTQMRSKLTALRDLTQRRLTDHAAGRTGPSIEQSYNALFGDIMALHGRYGRHLAEARVREEAWAKKVYAALGLLLAANTLLAAQLFRRARRKAHGVMQQQIAGRSTAEAALREREALLSSINANLTGTCVYRMVYAPDGAMTCLYVSPNVEQLIGITAEQYQADPKRVFGQIHEDDRATFRAALAATLRTGETGDAVVRVRTGVGAARWMQFRSHLYERRADGTQVRDGVVVDVTAIKAAELRLWRQSAFFTTLHQTAVDLLGRRDQAGLLQAIVNRSAALFEAAQVELDLLEGEALIASAFHGTLVALPGEHCTRAEAPLSWQAMESGQPVVVDNYSANNAARAVYRRLGFTATAIFPIMHGSRCLGTLGIARKAPTAGFSQEEITQGQVFGQLAALVLHQAGIHEDARREAALRAGQLRASEQQFERVVKNINDALIVDDTAGRLVFANRKFFELFGLPEQDLGGLVLEDYIAPEWRARLRDRHDRRIRGEAVPENYEFENLRPDGQRLWLEVSVTSVIEDGHATGSQSVIRDITERKRTERAMADSVELLRATLESTADGILTIGTEGKIQSFNRRFVEMWRIPDEIIASRDDDRALQFVLDQLADPGAFIEKVRHLYAHPSEESFDTLTFQDGRTFERYSRPMITGGQPTGRVWSFRDITARRQTERALAMMQFSVDHASDVVFWVGSDARILYANAAATRRLGYTNDELLQMFIHQFNPDFPVAVWPAYWADLRSCGAMTFESRHRTRDGRLVDVEVNANFVKFGRQEFNFAFSRDITERKRSEAALRENEELFRGVFEASPIPILLSTAPEGRLTGANTAALALFGYTRAEVLGRTTDEIGVWSRVEQRAEFFRRLASEKVVGNYEAVMRTKSGVERVMLCTGTLLTLAGQVWVLASAVDITALRRIEAEQTRMQQRLLQNQKFEALGTLAGGVAHDFNNILTGVINYTQLARSDCPPSHPRIREFLGEVLKCGLRAKDLVRQILLFSRSEDAERAAMPLQPVIKEALALLRSTVPASVEIKTDLELCATPVLANASQIHQVVMNLGINAAHAMQETGGTLTIRLRPRVVDAALAGELHELKPGPHLCLEMADTGAGMEPAVIARIFEPFYTTKKVGEGTGLGLAVVHSIMRAHEGAIAVRSQPERGTTFELFFPVQPAGPEATPTSPQDLPQGRGQRILLVDDEAAVGKSMKIMLERLNYRVTVFTNPANAAVRWEAAPGDFDALITDYQMPGMTGTVLAKRLLAARPELPVFIMSGFAGSKNPQSLRDEGFTDFLPKPIDLADLAETLARGLGG